MEESYPRPSLTVDVAVLRYRNGHLEILLIERARPPFEGRWALPGGFVDEDETPAEAAERELLEETAVSGMSLFEVGTYGAAGRDPRGWVVSVAFLALAQSDCEAQAGDDARNAIWHRLNELPPLAFDHDEIIRGTREALARRAQIDTSPLMLLPPTFRSSQARALYSRILEQKISPSAFKAWLRRRGAIERVGPARFKRSEGLNGNWLGR